MGAGELRPSVLNNRKTDLPCQSLLRRGPHNRLPDWVYETDQVWEDWPEISAVGNGFSMGADGRLWSFKAFYFLFYAAAAALLPFLALYYEGLGFNGRQIGLLAALPPLINLGAAAVWAAIADNSGRHRLVLGLAILGTIGFALGLWGAVRFPTILIMVGGFALWSAPIIPLGDSAAMQALGRDRGGYGRLRLWGAVGWGLAGPVAGRLVELFGEGSSFFSFAAILGLILPLLVWMPVDRPPLRGPVWVGLNRLLRQRQWAYFLLLMFVAGMGLALIHNYLFLYLRQIGASTSLMGLALTVATVSEIIAFSWAGRLIARLGTRTILYMALGALGLRLLSHFFIQNPWWVLPVQLSHGLTFALLWSAGVAYADSLAPPGMSATAQGVLSGVSQGLAMGAGALLGGWVYEAVGPFWLFGSFGGAILGALPMLIWLAPDQREEPGAAPGGDL